MTLHAASLLRVAASSILTWWVYLSPSDGAASPFSVPGSSLQGAQGPVYILTFQHIYPYLFQPPRLCQNSCKSGCIFLSETDKVSLAGGRQIAEQFAYRLF